MKSYILSHKLFFILITLLLAISYIVFSINNNYFSQSSSTVSSKDKNIINKMQLENTLYTNDTLQTSLVHNSSPSFTLNAKSAVLYDEKGNRFLYEKSGDEKLPMASTTKIMTCIIALTYADLDDIVTISPYAASMPDVQLNVNKGEQYVLQDLLYSLMLESHNDVAVAIAEHIGEKVITNTQPNKDIVSNRSKDDSKIFVSNFASLMNRKSKELGCTSTNFVTPNGLDNEEHYTTAKELAKIASYATQNDTFIDITNTPSYQFSEQSGKRSFSVSNKNSFLSQYEGAIGCKTGFTGNAGYCFVGAAIRNDVKLITVVLGCGWPPNKTYKWIDTKNLMNYGFKNYSLKPALSQTDFSQINNGTIPVDDAKNKEYISYEIKEKPELLLKDTENITYTIELPQKLSAPISNNQVIGTVNFYINDSIYKRIKIYTTDSAEKIDFFYCLDKVYNKLLRYKFLKCFN